jgi:hypothetical protein
MGNLASDISIDNNISNATLKIPTPTPIHTSNPNNPFLQDTAAQTARQSFPIDIQISLESHCLQQISLKTPFDTIPRQDSEPNPLLNSEERITNLVEHDFQPRTCSISNSKIQKNLDFFGEELGYSGFKNTVDRDRYVKVYINKLLGRINNEVSKVASVEGGRKQMISEISNYIAPEGLICMGIERSLNFMEKDTMGDDPMAMSKGSQNCPQNLAQSQKSSPGDRYGHGEKSKSLLRRKNSPSPYTELDAKITTFGDSMVMNKSAVGLGANSETQDFILRSIKKNIQDGGNRNYNSGQNLNADANFDTPMFPTYCQIGTLSDGSSYMLPNPSNPRVQQQQGPPEMSFEPESDTVNIHSSVNPSTILTTPREDLVTPGFPEKNLQRPVQYLTPGGSGPDYMAWDSNDRKNTSNPKEHWLETYHNQKYKEYLAKQSSGRLDYRRNASYQKLVQGSNRSPSDRHLRAASQYSECVHSSNTSNVLQRQKTPENPLSIDKKYSMGSVDNNNSDRGSLERRIKFNESTY